MHFKMLVTCFATLPQHNSTKLPMVMIKMAVFKLWYMMMLTCGGYSVSQAATSTWVTNTSSLGPVINVLCDTVTSISRTFTWTYNETDLASNDKLSADADPSRYSVILEQETVQGGTGKPYIRYTSLIQIRNALKQDGGVYTCRVRVTIKRDDGSTANINVQPSSTTVTINQYLPPPGYPKCIIHPSTRLIEHTDATFSCVSGDASPPMNLTLSLQKQNGLETELGNTEVTQQVTMDDNNTMFICYMMSETFPTAPQRMCSAGPIIIVEALPTTKPSLPVITQPPTVPGDKNGITKSDASNPSRQSSPVAGIIGGIVGGIILVLIIILIVIVVVRNNKQVPPDSANNRSPSKPENVYAQEVIGDPGNNASSSNQSQSSNQAWNQANQIPSYGEVNDGNNPDTSSASSYGDANHAEDDESDLPVYGKVQKGSDLPAYGEVHKESDLPVYGEVHKELDLPVYGEVHKENKTSKTKADNHGGSDSQGAESNDNDDEDIPVYGKVNKGNQNAEDNDESGNRESSGFVDNMIYTSAGPM